MLVSIVLEEEEEESGACFVYKLAQVYNDYC